MFLAWPKSGVLVVVVIPVAATPTAFLAWQKCGVLLPRFWHAQNAVYYYRVFGMAKMRCTRGSCNTSSDTSSGYYYRVFGMPKTRCSTTVFLAWQKCGVSVPRFWHAQNAVYYYRVFGVVKMRCAASSTITTTFTTTTVFFAMPKTRHTSSSSTGTTTTTTVFVPWQKRGVLVVVLILLPLLPCVRHRVMWVPSGGVEP